MFETRYCNVYSNLHLKWRHTTRANFQQRNTLFDFTYEENSFTRNKLKWAVIIKNFFNVIFNFIVAKVSWYWIIDALYQKLHYRFEWSFNISRYDSSVPRSEKMLIHLINHFLYLKPIVTNNNIHRQRHNNKYKLLYIWTKHQYSY